MTIGALLRPRTAKRPLTPALREIVRERKAQERELRALIRKFGRGE